MNKLFFFFSLFLILTACSEKIDQVFFTDSLKKDCKYYRAKCDTDFQKLKKEYQPFYIRENIYLNLATDEKKNSDEFIASINGLLKRDHFTSANIESVYSNFAAKYNRALDSATRVFERPFFFPKDTLDLRMQPFSAYGESIPDAGILAYYLQKQAYQRLDNMIVALTSWKISTNCSWGSPVTHYDLIIERMEDTLFLYLNNFTLPYYENADSLHITGIESIDKKESHMRDYINDVFFSNRQVEKGFLLKTKPLSPGSYKIYGTFRFKKPTGEIDRLEFEVPFEIVGLKKI
ncbi:MAG: hypothetical protein K0S33_1714 [Bacteroidetes bacterium]|jgi:hypothetical protein|nr:hypothetical protein [Bacteroidota bacterium]